jgi:hypothetical protein
VSAFDCNPAAQPEIGERLVTQFVEELLNHRRPAAIEQLIASTYRDFDPLPGLPSTRAGVAILVEFLQAREVDLHFTIENLSVKPPSVFARIFGEGYAPDLSDLRRSEVKGWVSGHARRRHVAMSSVSEFQYRHTRITTRWGAIRVMASEWETAD